MVEICQDYMFLKRFMLKEMSLHKTNRIFSEDLLEYGPTSMLLLSAKKTLDHIVLFSPEML